MSCNRNDHDEVEARQKDQVVDVAESSASPSVKQSCNEQRRSEIQTQGMTKFTFSKSQKSKIPSLRGAPSHQVKVKVAKTPSSAAVTAKKKFLKIKRSSYRRGDKTNSSVGNTVKSYILGRKINTLSELNGNCHNLKERHDFLKAKPIGEESKNMANDLATTSVFERLCDERKKQSSPRRFLEEHAFNVHNTDKAKCSPLERLERRLNYSPPQNVWQPHKHRKKSNQRTVSSSCSKVDDGREILPIFDRLYKNIKREQTLWTDPYTKSRNHDESLLVDCDKCEPKFDILPPNSKSDDPWNLLEEELEAYMTMSCISNEESMSRTSSDYDKDCDENNESINTISKIDSLLSEYESLLFEYDQIMSAQQGQYFDYPMISSPIAPCDSTIDVQESYNRYPKQHELGTVPDHLTNKDHFIAPNTPSTADASDIDCSGENDIKCLQHPLDNILDCEIDICEKFGKGYEENRALSTKYSINGERFLNSPHTDSWNTTVTNNVIKYQPRTECSNKPLQRASSSKNEQFCDQHANDDLDDRKEAVLDEKACICPKQKKDEESKDTADNVPVNRSHMSCHPNIQDDDLKLSVHDDAFFEGSLNNPNTYSWNTTVPNYVTKYQPRTEYSNMPLQCASSSKNERFYDQHTKDDLDDRKEAVLDEEACTCPKREKDEESKDTADNVSVNRSHASCHQDIQDNDPTLSIHDDEFVEVGEQFSAKKLQRWATSALRDRHCAQKWKLSNILVNGNKIQQWNTSFLLFKTKFKQKRRNAITALLATLILQFILLLVILIQNVKPRKIKPNLYSSESIYSFEYSSPQHIVTSIKSCNCSTNDNSSIDIGFTSLITDSLQMCDNKTDKIYGAYDKGTSNDYSDSLNQNYALKEISIAPSKKQFQQHSETMNNDHFNMFRRWQTFISKLNLTFTDEQQGKVQNQGLDKQNVRHQFISKIFSNDICFLHKPRNYSDSQSKNRSTMVQKNTSSNSIANFNCFETGQITSKSNFMSSNDNKFEKVGIVEIIKRKELVDLFIGYFGLSKNDDIRHVASDVHEDRMENQSSKIYKKKLFFHQNSYYSIFSPDQYYTSHKDGRVVNFLMEDELKKIEYETFCSVNLIYCPTIEGNHDIGCFYDTGSLQKNMKLEEINDSGIADEIDGFLSTVDEWINDNSYTITGNHHHEEHPPTIQNKTKKEHNRAMVNSAQSNSIIATEFFTMNEILLRRYYGFLLTLALESDLGNHLSNHSSMLIDGTISQILSLNKHQDLKMELGIEDGTFSLPLIGFFGFKRGSSICMKRILINNGGSSPCPGNSLSMFATLSTSILSDTIRQKPNNWSFLNQDHCYASLVGTLSNVKKGIFLHRLKSMDSRLEKQLLRLRKISEITRIVRIAYIISKGHISPFGIYIELFKHLGYLFIKNFKKGPKTISYHSGAIRSKLQLGAFAGKFVALCTHMKLKVKKK